MKTFNLIISIVLGLLALGTIIYAFTNSDISEFRRDVTIGFIETLLGLIFYLFYLIEIKEDEIWRLRALITTGLHKSK